MDRTRVAALIESFENLGCIALDAHAIIYHLQYGILCTLFRYTHLDGTVVIGIFESIREQIIHNLIEGIAVEPHLQLIDRRGITEIDIPFLGRIFVGFQDVTHILHHIRLLALQLHLLFVDLADIQYLIHEILNALSIMFDGIQFILHLTIEVLPQQLVEWTHD